MKLLIFSSISCINQRTCSIELGSAAPKPPAESANTASPVPVFCSHACLQPSEKWLSANSLLTINELLPQCPSWSHLRSLSHCYYYLEEFQSLSCTEMTFTGSQTNETTWPTYSGGLIDAEKIFKDVNRRKRLHIGFVSFFSKRFCNIYPCTGTDRKSVV